MSAQGLLTRLLSPLTLSGLNTDHTILREDGEDDDDNDVFIETVTYYVCPECDEEHDNRSEAVACCDGQRGTKAAKKLLDSGVRCPICDEWCADAHAAANCCLWKDLTAESRRLIANAFEDGAEWPDAIAAHGVKA